MEEALIQVGLPVKCRKCKKEGRVKPRTDYGGWYKYRVMGTRPNRWFCPEHAEIGKRSDENFYQMSLTPEPEPTAEDSTEELYKLLD